jgi:hypothetical protein
MNRKSNHIKLYNMLFPIWLLWLFPQTWLIVLPANFIIDSLVVLVTLRLNKSNEIKSIYKKVIFKVWGFGFLADFIGTVLMFIPNLIDFEYSSDIGRWWYDNLSNAVSYNPFHSVYALLWVTLSVLITSILIYLFNYKISFRKLAIEDTAKKRLALSLAIFTAPYLLYLPSKWFY